MRQRRSWQQTARYFTILLLPIGLILTSSVLTAQTTLELLGAAPNGGPSTSGPSTSSQTVTFYTTTTAAYTPPLTATYTLSNQQFSTTEGNPSVAGTTFGTNIQTSNNNNAATNLALANASYGFMNAISGNNAASINPFYTACSTCGSGTGMDIATNNSVWLLNASDALINSSGASAHALNARVQFADLTITFNRPVDNPVVHLTGLGGFYQYNTTIPVGGTVTNYTQGFTTDVDLITSGLTWTKLSGNSVMDVTSTQISNTATRFGTATLGSTALTITRTAASGSVVVNGAGITSFTMRLYLRGDGGIVQDNTGTVVAANNGNNLQWSSQLNHTPSGQSANVNNAFAGDAFLVGLSLLPPPCALNLTANASDCYDSNGNIAGGSSMTNVQAVVDWSDIPSGETINVTCTGATAQSIDPATSPKPAILTFAVPANGANATVTATFSTTATCTATSNVTRPAGNCVLTPCCPAPTAQTFSNTTFDALYAQTDCNTTLTKTIVVSGLTGTISDLNVGLLLTHTFRGDVKIELTSPLGTTVTLANQSTDNLDHYDLLLDDAASGSLNNGANQDTLAPNYGADRTAKPSNPLSAFNGQNPNGTWTLTFCNTNFSTSGGRLLTFKGATLNIEALDPAACANKTGGKVWRDFNNNGLKDSNEAEGIAAVSVKAIDCNGNVVETVTTDYLGQYTFTNVTPSVSNPIRLEFSNVPAPYKTSATGADNGTDVQFITAAGCGYNLGVNNPVDYCQANPSLTVNCYVTGAYNSGSGTGLTIVGVPYNITQDPDGNTNGTTAAGAVSFDPPIYTPARPMKTPVADHSEIASTWGLAYDRVNKNLFASAYVKSGTSLGPNNESTGKIYKINDPLSTSVVSDYVDLNTVFGAGTAGVNPHPIGSTSFAALDDAATNAVIGKVGLGDMAISNDNAFLYTVNLADRKLYKIPTSGALNSTTIQRFDIPTTGLPVVMDAAGTAGTCPSGDVRPFGLGVHPDGSIYVGGVCSGESISAGYNAVENPASYQLTAYVWKFDGAAFTLQLNESLRFDRDGMGGSNAYTTIDDFNAAYSPSTHNLDWEPWHDLSNAAIYNTQSPSQNEPMLSDISFDEKGDMFLGVRDRMGDCVTLNGGFLSSGDIYKAYKTTTGWAFEKNATCDPNTTAGANNRQGPGGGEFIHQDIQGDGIPNSGTGGVFNLMGQYQVVTTTIDPVYQNSSGGFIFNPSAGGVQVFGTTDGSIKGAYDIYENYDINTFAKAAGVGAIAAICDPSPIQVGNYVWKDADKDGVQDPCETPLSNVTISLWKNGVQIAQTTTNSSGNYYFSSKYLLGAAWTGTGADTALLPNMAYEIRIDTAMQTLIFDKLTLTTANATANTGNDQNDNDATTSGVYKVIALTTGGAGSTNHTYDFGFYPFCDTTLTVSNTTICNGSAVNLFAQASGAKGTLTYSTNGTTWTALTNPTNVTPSVSTTYFVKDTLTSGCVDIDTLQITVNQPVTAGVGTNPAAATCQAGSGLSNIDLAGQITGATSGGAWSQTSGTAVGAALNTTTGVLNPNGIQAGTYTFRYTVTGATPCPNDTEDITITIQNCCPPSVCIPVSIMRN